jgi:fatty-acyl-CoA synthase
MEVTFMNNSWIGNYSYFRSRISPTKEAIYDYENKISYTYGDLENRANLLANYLVEVLEIDKGDRIAFCTRNCIELFDAYYATAKIGAILVTYNQLLSENELINMINNETPSVLFYEGNIEEKIIRIREKTNISKFIELDGNNNGRCEYKYKDIMNYKNSDYRECKDLDLEDIHMIIHTGGTTGIPKGAKISHRSLLYNSLSAAMTFNLSQFDSSYIMTPMFHTAAWSVLTLPILHMGGRIIISKKNEPKLTLKIINNERPTVLLGVSTLFGMMIKEKEFDSTDYSSLRWILSAAAPTPISTMEKFWEKGVKFALAYGMTEAGPCNCTTQADCISLDDIKKKHTAVGKPMYFTQVKVVDDIGNEVERGQCGELIWSGPGIYSGYWNNEKESNKTLKDGWVYTGDIGRKDEDGYYYIVGRKKNMFISGGENIYPPEIESEIQKHPLVDEVCVIGFPDEKWGEVGKAIVAVKSNEDLDEEEVIFFLKNNMSSIKIPKYYHFVDNIPKNSAGKIQRGVLQQLYGMS